MAERLVPADERFAAELDDNCEQCRGGGGNARQLLALRARKGRGIGPQEGRVLQALLGYCGACLAAGKPEGRTISDKYSCAWRERPWQEVKWEE